MKLASCVSRAMRPQFPSTSVAAPFTGKRWLSDSSPAKVKMDVTDSGVAVLTFSNPTKLNMMTIDLGTSFEERIQQINSDPAGIRAVVLTGEGKAFSAGGDLEFLLDRQRDSPSRNAYIMRNFYQRFLCVRSLPVPTIAAINGPAVGAGLCVALACDMRIASKTAKMGLTFTGLGLHPGMGGTHFLPQIVGSQMASRMMLTGELITGERAQEIGLVLEAVDKDEVLSAALDLANQIGKQAPIAVRSCVRSLRIQQDEGLERALWREADAQSYAYASDDLKEGVESVRDKRKPSYTQFEQYKE